MVGGVLVVVRDWPGRSLKPQALKPLNPEALNAKSYTLKPQTLIPLTSYPSPPQCKPETEIAKVVALLRKRGVDLDHNRFLILQGRF